MGSGSGVIGRFLGEIRGLARRVPKREWNPDLGSQDGFRTGTLPHFPPGGARAIPMRDPSRARVTRNQGGSVEKLRPPTRASVPSSPTALCRVDESSISRMDPGDIFVIEKLDSSDSSYEPSFHAVLACPLCGDRVLITAAQYFGFSPIVCGAKACSGFFRIVDEGRVAYLPAN